MCMFDYNANYKNRLIKNSIKEYVRKPITIDITKKSGIYRYKPEPRQYYVKLQPLQSTQSVQQGGCKLKYLITKLDYIKLKLI